MRRRRVLVTAAVMAAVATGTPLLLSSGGDNEGRRLEVVAEEPGDTSGPPTDGLAIEPDTGLVDGDVVSVGGDFDTSDVVGVGQCASEARTGADRLDWCDSNVPWDRVSTRALAVTVARTIETPSGIVDCAERAGRCHIGVRAGEANLIADIVFNAQLEATPVAVIHIDDTGARDGERVRVAGSGFPRASEVYINLCLNQPANATDGLESRFQECDLARGARTTTGDDGSFDIPFIAYADVLLYGGWQRCAECVIQATAVGQVQASANLDIAIDGAPIRPSVAIEPVGPYTRGQYVTLRGAGFQDGSTDLSIGWCAFQSETPETEVQGDPARGYATCSYPREGLFGVTTNDVGRFTVEGFPMPSGPFGWRDSGDCATPRTRCGLAWHPGEGTPPAFVTLFELAA